MGKKEVQSVLSDYIQSNYIWLNVCAAFDSGMRQLHHREPDVIIFAISKTEKKKLSAQRNDS